MLKWFFKFLNYLVENKVNIKLLVATWETFTYSEYCSESAEYSTKKIKLEFQFQFPSLSLVDLLQCTLYKSLAFRTIFRLQAAFVTTIRVTVSYLEARQAS
jgi:hypothetical protein